MESFMLFFWVFRTLTNRAKIVQLMMMDPGCRSRQDCRQLWPEVAVVCRIGDARIRADDDLNFDKILPNISFTECVQRYRDKFPVLPL